jgi:3-oxoacid CoA-transferase
VVQECTLPLTGTGVVDMIITDLAVFRFPEGRLTLTELMPGATVEQVRAATPADFAEALT